MLVSLGLSALLFTGTAISQQASRGGATSGNAVSTEDIDRSNVDCDGEVDVRFEMVGFGPTALPWDSADGGTDTLLLPKVELGPGETLVGAVLEGCMGILGSWGVENMNPQAPCFQWVYYEGQGEIAVKDGPTIFGDLTPWMAGAWPLAWFDGTVDYAGLSGFTFHTLPLGNWDIDLQLVGPGPALDSMVAQFPGDTLELSHLGNPLAISGGCDSTEQLMDFEAFLCLKVAYIVCQEDVCFEGDPLVVDSVVNFSDLDGSATDNDGVANGVLELDGLVIEGWGKILVDVPSAEFIVWGDVMLSGEGKILNYSWFLPDTGPDITVWSCGSIYMDDRSVIRSYGDLRGGNIRLCAEDDICMDFIAGIECGGFDLPEGFQGGSITCSAGDRFDMKGILTYITVEGEGAGSVDIAACGTDDDVIDVRGRILADGTDPDGLGGWISLDARNGGIFLPGVDKCLATGDDADGVIHLAYRTGIGPNNPPIVHPEAIEVFDGPDNGPCTCDPPVK